MEIPDPVANRGDTVMVHNYRSKPKDGSIVMEEGVVESLSYENSFGHFSWMYVVRLVRRTKAGKPIRLYVLDEDIKKADA